MEYCYYDMHNFKILRSLGLKLCSKTKKGATIHKYNQTISKNRL